MSKKKQETTQSNTNQFQNTNTYGWQNMPSTPEIDAFKNWVPQTDPSSPYRFARARQDLEQSHNNVYGSYETPVVREHSLRTGYGNLQQQEGQAMREGQYDVNNQMLNKLSALANLTAPRLTQTGGSGTSSGTGTSTTTQSGGLLESLLGGAAGAGSSLLMPIPAGGSM